MICFMVSSDLMDTSRYRQMGGARVPRVPVGLPLGQCASSHGLYYKTITIVINAPSVVKSDAPNCSVTLEASFTIVTWLFPMFMVLASVVTIV
jgi:hypothetical protein